MEKDMCTYIETGKTKSPKPPNHLPTGSWVPTADAWSSPRSFKARIKDRQTTAPSLPRRIKPEAG